MIRSVDQEDTAEEVLQKSVKASADYRHVLEEALIVTATDDKGIINYANDNFCKISKYSREELIGYDHGMINSGFHSRDFIKSLWTTIANGKIWRGELRNKAKDGTYYWVDTTIVPFLNDDGKPYEYIASCADITARKEAEEGLQKSLKELSFRNKVNDNRAAALIIANKELAFQNDEKGKRAAELVMANVELVFQNNEKEKRASELVMANIELAFQNNEKEKRAAELVIANEELAFQNQEKEKRAAELVMANVELVFQNNEKEKRASELIIANTELAFQNKEKEKRAAELVIANEELAFQNQEKEKRAAELVMANVELVFQNNEKEKRASELIVANTELAFQNKEKEKRAAELIVANEELAFQNREKEKRAGELTASAAELESVNQELESFSYSVSHDLRTPLRAVNGYAKMLEEDYNDLFDDEGRRMLAVVRDNAKKMGLLIDDLLTFSRLGRKEMNESTVNMKLLVENAFAELGTSPQFKAVITTGDLHPVIADATLMNQVWINLISNAIKYSSNNKNPVINIGSERKNKELIYSIADNGVGFDMKYVHKLFGVFQRLHSSGTFEGTGVGLALVHRIITKHGGKIWAEAEIDKGATFYFSLPDKKQNKTK